jgi:hypothetical protein
MGVSGVAGLIFVIAAAYRLYQRKLDGIYVILYTIMILVWPFSYAANAEKRFALVIVPVLLFQVSYFIVSISAALFRRLHFNPAEVIYFSAVILLALPALALVTTLYFQPVSQDLEPYRRVGWWYNWYWKDSVIPDYRYVKYARVISKGLPVIGEHVPEGECIYSVKPYLVGFYTRRISKYPPKEILGDADFSRELGQTGCRYFFFMNDVSHSYSEKRFYPEQRLGDSVEPIVILDYTEGDARHVTGVLGRLK